MPYLSETEKHLDKGYVLFRYYGVYDTASLIIDTAAFLKSAPREEILNLRALVVDLNAVSEITMSDSDRSLTDKVFREMKLACGSVGIDILEIIPNIQRIIICPTHLKELWKERTERFQRAHEAWQLLPENVVLDSHEAAVAAINPL
jgi:hypothetical protein